MGTLSSGLYYYQSASVVDLGKTHRSDSSRGEFHLISREAFSSAHKCWKMVRCIPLAYETLILVFALWKSFQLRRESLGHFRHSLVEILIRDQIIYFLAWVNLSPGARELKILMLGVGPTCIPWPWYRKTDHLGWLSSLYAGSSSIARTSPPVKSRLLPS